VKLYTLAIALCLATVEATSVTSWHNKLVASTPKKDEKLEQSPKELRLWFKEPVEPKFSSITLLDQNKKKVTIGKVQKTSDSTSIRAEVTAKLAAGRYTINWRTVGIDGHKVKGTFAFSVK
jgi:copper resistance protein C